MAAPVAPAAQPTFNWIGDGTPEDNGCIYFDSFQFCNTKYTVGEHVFLLPEDEASPLYVARIVRAFEDPRAPDSDRLCIEVRWYERKANMPAAFQTNMHDRELVESLQSDTNLVGCIDHKATVVHARSYDEAAAQVAPADLAGEWYFCRGVLDSEGATFRTYEELEAAAAAAASHPMLNFGGGDWPFDPSLVATTSGLGGGGGDDASHLGGGGGGGRRKRGAAQRDAAAVGGPGLFTTSALHPETAACITAKVARGPQLEPGA